MNMNKKLHLGCGSVTLPGWLNTDMYPGSDIERLDVTQNFHYNDNSFNYIFTEHMIEHIYYPEAQFMLNECHRVLVNGGIIRIATPNLEAIISLLSINKTYIQKKYISWINNRCGLRETKNGCFVINNTFYNWGHKFIYDFSTITSLLESKGFEKIIRCEVGKSAINDLTGLESHGKMIGDEEINIYETMVVEAVCKKTEAQSY